MTYEIEDRRPLACLICGRYKILDEDDPLYCGGSCLRMLEDIKIDSD